MSDMTAPPPEPTGIAGGPVPPSMPKRVAWGVGLLAVAAFLGWSAAYSPSDNDRRNLPQVGGAAGATRPVIEPDFRLPEPPPITPASLPMPAASTAPFQPRPAPRPAARRGSSPMMAWEERGATQSDTGAQRTATTAATGDEPGDDLAMRLRATRTETARAQRMRNPHLTIPAGFMIPCTPQQPLNTQLPGFLSCIVPSEVYGATGSTVLLDRGTQIVGQMRTQMQHGQNRAFIVWTRARTPDGVTIELGSPGTDAMGQNGLNVTVETNFWQRFGGAIMLSFIDAGLQAAALGAANTLQPTGNGSSMNFIQMQSGGSNAAARALDSSVNIPPYGFRPHGEPAAIFVARDLDFSAVYRLRPTQ